MLSKEQQSQWEALQATLTREQQIWFAGYVQGMALQNLPQPVSLDANPAPAAQAAQKLRVYFATETGNSKMIAQQLAKQSKKLEWNAQAAPIKRANLKELSKLSEPVVFVVSTHGEGDPPESAVAFFDELKNTGVSLDGLSYAVLGLGDSSYPEFCKAAADLDEHLQRLGAKSFQPRVDLDVDFGSHVPGWLDKTVNALPKQIPQEVADAFASMEGVPLPNQRGYSRLEPIKGTVAEIVKLNDVGSEKATYHIEIEYDEALEYAPGDAAGIMMNEREDGVALLTPRLYSIASSPAAHGNSIHLTVALAWHYNDDGTKGYGICSEYLSNLKEGDEVEFYIQKNHLFKLPEDGRDMIMIGPGTGVAPFRSFLWERYERDAGGRNWLFFGEQHQHCDFLYQAEWIELIEAEALQKIDLAFSRDQEEKVYVQHRLKEKADQVYEWLENGAALYVCGDKERMSVDVENALLEILAERKGGQEAAEAYLDQLEEDNRYLKDVY